MTSQNLLWFTVAALALEIVVTVGYANLVKRNKKLNTLYALVPSAAFVTFHIAWWMRHAWGVYSITGYVFASVASVAFLFGTAFMTTGCLALKNGELCINQCNRAFKLIRRLPLKFEGKSLCAISWLAALLIFALPVILALIGILGFVASFIICGFTGQNPLDYYIEMMKLETWPHTEAQYTHKGNGIPKGPLGYVIVITLLVLFVRLILEDVSGLLRILGYAAEGAGVVILFWIVFECIGVWLYHRSRENISDYEVRRAYLLLEDRATRPLAVFNVCWQVFRHKFCPKIKYCKLDAGEEDCSESTS